MDRLKILPQLIILLLLTSGLCAQPKYRLVRTNKESVPIKVQLYGGYNGVSDPSENLQNGFENTEHTYWGGFMGGLKALVTLDTLGAPIWAGFEAYYHRTAKRWMAFVPGVRYPDSNGLVDAIETLHSWGLQAIVAFGPVERVQIEFGGGAQYLQSKVDQTAEIIGVIKPVWLPTYMAGIDIILLKYEHGSIDGNFRAMKTFGDYTNFQFQSLLCFTFNF